MPFPKPSIELYVRRAFLLHLTIVVVYRCSILVVSSSLWSPFLTLLKSVFLRTYCGLSVDPKIHKTAPLTSTEQFSWIFEPIDYPKFKKTTDFWAIQSSLKKGYFWIFNFVTELNLHIFTVFIKPIQKDLIFFYSAKFE